MDPLVCAGEPPARYEAPEIVAEVQERVHCFASLRAAQRALEPSSIDPLWADVQALRGIRERLGSLNTCLEKPEAYGEPDPVAIHEELFEVDGALDGFARVLVAKLEALPLAQLRASLSAETAQQRVEATALLHLCMRGEPTLLRHLSVVDLLITLLSVTRRDEYWVLEADPASLDETISSRCWAAGECDPEVERRITRRFQEAAESLTGDVDGAAVLREMTAYKAEIAGFYFVPAVLRCVIGYNVAARNHIEQRQRESRARDASIDEEMGIFGSAEEESGAPVERRSALPASESIGVIAVEEAIRRRLAGAPPAVGPASRIAARLDPRWLEEGERYAFRESAVTGAHRITRMAVVLGYLAVTLPECRSEFAALGLSESQLDSWLCDLGDETQAEMNELIRINDYDAAVRLGDVKSKFLAAVLMVVRRRANRRRWRTDGEPDELAREAIALVRAYMERQRFSKPPAMFLDLFGGGWRRTLALTLGGVLLVGLVSLNFAPAGPRATNELSDAEARRLSPYLLRAYRDYAAEGSMFVGTLTDAWAEMAPDARRRVANQLKNTLLERNVEEILLYDDAHRLQAYYREGIWLSAPAWED